MYVCDNNIYWKTSKKKYCVVKQDVRKIIPNISRVELLCLYS